MSLKRKSALDIKNKQIKRRKLLAKQLKRESGLVRDESMKTLKEFEEIDDKNYNAR